VRPIILATVGFLTTITAMAAQPQKPDRVWAAPSVVESRRSALANEPEILAGGKKVFHQRCAVCHGKDGTGGNRGPNLMTARVQRQSDGALFWKISSGNTRTGMPGFSFLPEAQRWQLVLHLRAEAK